MKQYEVKYIIPEDCKGDLDNPYINLKRKSLVYLQYSEALRTMARLLLNDMPAWIIESVWDDDIPF
jgi:hypothetical protein